MEVSITFSLSGSFDFANRDRIEQQIQRKGLKISKEVNKKCQFLIVGRNAHENKIQEAKRLNLPLISSSYLEDLIRGKTDDWKQYVLQKEEEGKRKRKVSVRIEDGKFIKKQKISVSPSKQPAPPKSRVIALEGQIGVGKSTLCGKFEKTFPDTCSSYKEQTNEQFLKLFYSDTKKYGFAFQWGMLKSRIYQLQLARHNAKYPEVPPRDYYFWDRSMLGDYMFALWNHLLGGISREEMDVYESEFGGGFNDLGSVPFLQDIDCFVFLNDEPANCKYRVEQKRKNESEQGIPLDYYDGIDDMHFNIFMKLLHERVGPVLILNWGQYHDPQLALTVIEEVCTGARRTPIVKYINEDEIPTQDPAKKQKFYVYRTGKQITEAFDELKVQEDLEDLRDYSDIYIPLEALTVKKKVVKNNYNVAFHENAYKRIVLWHLSQFQNVIFYSQS